MSNTISGYSRTPWMVQKMLPEQVELTNLLASEGTRGASLDLYILAVVL